MRDGDQIRSAQMRATGFDVLQQTVSQIKQRSLTRDCSLHLICFQPNMTLKERTHSTSHISEFNESSIDFGADLVGLDVCFVLTPDHLPPI